MAGLLGRLQDTAGHKWLLVARLLAGVPLVFFSFMHFRNLDHFRDILVATGIPLVELNVVAASATELLAGLLLLGGFLARVGGLLGAGTMVVAVYSTITLAGLELGDLPPGLTQVPAVPPLPLPLIVLLSCLIVVKFGAGPISLDSRMRRAVR